METATIVILSPVKTRSAAGGRSTQGEESHTGMRFFGPPMADLRMTFVGH
jgi:hypothetical protein